MASGTADLQRDLGGALMTSIFGALLTAGYAASMGTAIADSGQDVTATTQSQLQLSYASAADLAEQYPAVRTRRSWPPRSSPSSTATSWPTWPASSAVIIGAGLVFLYFPRKEDEERMRLAFHQADDAEASGA